MAVSAVAQVLFRTLPLLRAQRRRRPPPPPGIDVRVELEGAFFQLDRLNASHQRIIIRALNRAAERARTQTRRELALEKGLPQKVLNRRIRAYKASRMKMRAALWVGVKKRITAAELGGNVGTGAGGVVRIGRRTFKDAFRATMPGGHRGIYTRKPGAVHKKRPDGQMSQLPIEEAVVQLMPEAERISRRAAEHHMRRTYPAELKRLIRRHMESKRI